jgi:Na+-translocating ferredoxin:NAD+ oxidoreductase subunit G
MKETVKSTITLGAITALAGLALGFVFSNTRPKIEALEKETGQRAIQIALPGYTIGEEKFYTAAGVRHSYWEGVKNDNAATTKGYAFICESPGYSGIIRIMVGISAEKDIQGMYILKQSETPGLGARSVEVSSSSTFADFVSGTIKAEDATPWFQKQFFGLSLARPLKLVKQGDWKPAMAEALRAGNEVTAITGATITSTAVIKAVERGVADFTAVVDITPAANMDAATGGGQ